MFEEQNFGYVATLREDGRPAVRPTWVDVEGDIVVLNGNEERIWVRDLPRDPRVRVEAEKISSWNPTLPGPRARAYLAASSAE